MSKRKKATTQFDPCDTYWAQLMGQAKVSLSGASDVGLRAQLFDTLQRFFDESNCWQEIIVFNVVSETLDYPLYPVNGGRILRLLGVLDQNRVPQAAIMPEIGTVRFQYPYSQTQPMAAFLIKTVTDPLTCFPPGVPEWLLPTHYLTLLHGVLGEMMLQPGMSFSNPQMANYHTQKFRDGIAHARVATMKANTVGAQNWVFPRNFHVSSQRGGVSTFNIHPSGLLR
jgi:hypothetical protein